MRSRSALTKALRVFCSRSSSSIATVRSMMITPRKTEIKAATNTTRGEISWGRSLCPLMRDSRSTTSKLISVVSIIKNNCRFGGDRRLSDHLKCFLLRKYDQLQKSTTNP